MSIEEDLLINKIKWAQVLAAEAEVVRHLEENFFNRLYMNDPLPEKSSVIDFDEYKKNRSLRWKRKIGTTT